MEKLTDSRKTAEILHKYDFTVRKNYGQNFLLDGHVMDKIIAGAGVTAKDTILEIGPGIGSMTQYLAEAASRVIGVEIDSRLIPILNETLAEYNNVEIIQADILSVDLNRLIEEKNGGAPVKVVANLPYYITTPVIMMLLEQKIPIENITVMVQKEVAQRMQASPGTKDYGSLSLAVQYYADPYIAANVPANCFMPRPKVDSAVVRLTKYETPPIQAKDEKLLFKIIRAVFNQRRKTLVNSLFNSPELNFTKEQITGAITGLGKDPSVRGETLTLREFADLTDLLLPYTI